MNFQQFKSEVNKELENQRSLRLLEINLYREQLYQQFLDQVGLEVKSEQSCRD
jgi:hypothetical protein